MVRGDVRMFWAKLGRGATPHPLICHAVDTAVVAEELFDVFPGSFVRRELARVLTPLGDPKRWAALFAGLHDLGKCSPTFQALRSDVAKRVLEPAAPGEGRDVAFQARNVIRGIRTDTRHGVLTAVHLQRIIEGWGADRRKAATPLAQTLGGHHGVIPSASLMRDARGQKGANGGVRWQWWTDELVREYLGLFGMGVPDRSAWQRLEFTVPAIVALAGLTTVSDWIASDRAPSTYGGADLDLSVYLRSAQELEAAKGSRLGWAPWEPPADVSFGALFSGRQARPMQAALEKAVRDAAGAGVWVVAAPTGEGKTKAALQAVAILVEKLGLHGYFLAMPTKATAFQAYKEACALPGAEGRVRLLHSSAAEQLAELVPGVPAGEALEDLHDVDLDGCGLIQFAEVTSGEASEKEIVQDWFVGKRGLLGPLGAGTVDQVLKAGIRSRHSFLRLAALSGKVVVFDEVHGYDSHMIELFEHLLWWLGRMRVPVVLLSATMPTVIQQRWITWWRSGALGRKPETTDPASPATPAYPRIVGCDESGEAFEVDGFGMSSLNEQRVVTLERVGWNERLDWVLQRARNGQSVALVHNLRQSAIDDHELLATAIHDLPVAERPELLLLHGKLDAGPRAQVEEKLHTLLGPHGEFKNRRSRQRGVIVVGTMVLEAGLDLDFDTMLSALAPIDSLVQRMGRIKRHRPAEERTELTMGIIGVWNEAKTGRWNPKTPNLPPSFPRYTSQVYPKALLLRTWALIHERESITSPTDVQVLVDLVYSDVDLAARVGCPRGWERVWKYAHEAFLARRTGDLRTALDIKLPLLRSMDELPRLTEYPESTRQTRASRPW